ncbi:MAG: MotA/TolQ/ExbB proton channel family protein [Gammaproteobacteria bacterium]
MAEYLTAYRDFFDLGGPVLAAILFISIILWALIIERYWFFIRAYPGKRNGIAEQWQRRQDQSSWYALRLREGLLSELSMSLQHNLISIQAIIAILPLLGLLGTVTGMISIFEVLNVFGNGNPRGMAAGISKALLPTTAGLATSLIGLFFSTDLNSRANRMADNARDLLIHH